MKIEKRGDSFRVRKTLDGVTYSITFDHKPNKLEIEKEVDKLKANSSSNHEFVFSKAAEQYIAIKRNVLSSATVVNYKSIAKNLPKWFCDMKVDRINSVDVQKVVNEYAINRSPKTTRNASGFISAVLSFYAPDLNLHTKLPQKVASENYVPTDKEVKTILKASAGTEYELAFRLAVYGLRRSEIIAIDSSCLDGNLLTIKNASVVGEDKGYHIKTTKSEAGTRQIYIDEDLANAIRKKGVAYKGFPGSIVRALHRIQDQNGIPHFRLHDFRVYYASMSHAIKIPDAYIMKSGGWKSQSTLTNIYRKTMSDKVKSEQEKYIKKLNKLTKN